METSWIDQLLNGPSLSMEHAYVKDKKGGGV